MSFSDLLLLAQHYGTAQPLYEGGDLTGDGTVDFSDLLLLAQNYGQSSMPAAAVSSTPSTVSPTDVWSVLGRRKRTAHPVLSDFSQAGPPT